eukprot:TRINITY_DN1287_c0_g1_i1.p1 TRINITY_DN1287_c0_g1~~TRINITY_DN1287_c0_g1_i1.p1  ORF type:complete len:479 (+),score=79.38 TRINITY_DN1287_c0_g1_i1:567-2003(+)
MDCALQNLNPLVLAVPQQSDQQTSERGRVNAPWQRAWTTTDAESLSGATIDTHSAHRVRARRQLQSSSHIPAAPRFPEPRAPAPHAAPHPSTTVATCTTDTTHPQLRLEAAMGMPFQYAVLVESAQLAPLRIVSTELPVHPPFVLRCLPLLPPSNAPSDSPTTQSDSSALVLVAILLDHNLCPAIPCTSTPAIPISTPAIPTDSRELLGGNIEPVRSSRAVFAQLRFHTAADSDGRVWYLQFCCYAHYGTPDQSLVGLSARIPMVIVHPLPRTHRAAKPLDPLLYRLLHKVDPQNIPASETIGWESVAEALPTYFAKHAQVARTLQASDLYTLRTRFAFQSADGEASIKCDALSSKCIAWLDAIAETLRADPSVSQLWEQNLILGLVPRSDAETLLRGTKDGTLCVRFAESDFGALAAGYLSEGVVVWTKIASDALRRDSLAQILRRSKIPSIVDSTGGVHQILTAITPHDAAPYSHI